MTPNGASSPPARRCSESTRVRPSAIPSEATSPRACLLAAIAVVLAWSAIYQLFTFGPLADEDWHVEVASHFAEKRSGWPEGLTTPPGYHLFVNALGGGDPGYTAARLTSTLFALLALGAFAAARRRLHATPPGPATLLLALLPILLPFTALAYNDVASLALLLCAWWLQLGDRFLFSAAFLVLACLVRQTNIIWAGFFVGWEVLRALSAADDSSSPVGSRLLATSGAVLRRAGWHVAAILACAGVILWAGRLMPTHHDPGHWVRPNLATLHFGALLLLVLGLPVWLLHGHAAAQDVLVAARARPARFVFLAGAVVLAVAILAVTFENPHFHNRIHYGRTGILRYAYLRNWPLVAIDAHPWLRVLSGAVVVGMTLALIRVFRRQRHARALTLAVIFGAVLLGSNFLVEPRYYLTPAVMLLSLLDFDRRTAAWLAAWFAVINIAYAPFILEGYSLW